MIAYIKGQLTFILDESIIVDVGGIGYEIVCPNPFIYQNSLQKEVFIFTYQHVREDNQTLYGFKDEEEKYLFTKLISVSGIGPKSAVAILGNAEVDEFIAAIEQEDEKYLTKFPGVGKKTARQIILDLKGKLAAVFSLEETTTTVSYTSSTHISEAKEALKALGYTDKEINHVMSQLKKENITETDELIRKALALFVKN